MRLKEPSKVSRFSLLAFIMAFVAVLGLNPASAWAADTYQMRKDATLTIHVLDNSSVTNGKPSNDVSQMLPKNAKPVGAGYAYSLIKLNHDAMQQLSQNGAVIPNKEAADKVLADLSKYIDKVGGNSTIYYGITDTQGTIGVGNRTDNGVWLKDAGFDSATVTITGGSPARFTLDTTDSGLVQSTYWLLQLVGSPKNKSTTAEASVIQLPNIEQGTMMYDVEIYPKVQTRDLNDKPGDPGKPDHNPSNPNPGNPGGNKEPGCPNCIDPIAPNVPKVTTPGHNTGYVTGGTGASIYTPTGRLAATGSVTLDIIIITSLLSVLAAGLLFIARHAAHRR
jgi:hypothetical protein